MKKLGMLGIIGGAAMLTAVPLSLQWSQKNVTLSLASAEAQEGPTATSVAGVSRRAHRRAHRSAAYASAPGYGHGSYSGYGYPAYSNNYWIPYGTSYAAPYGIYSSSYGIARERLKSGYAGPYGPIFY